MIIISFPPLLCRPRPRAQNADGIVLDMAEVIVILGQSLNADGSAPPVLTARVEAAAALAAWLPSAPLITTGGDPARTGTSEVATMAELLQGKGVSRERIVLEAQAQNTVQNALLSLPLVPAGASRLWLVTSDFHMPRSLYLFEAAAAAADRGAALAVRAHAAPTPAAAAGGGVSAINAQGRTERLQLEARMLREDFVQRHLPTHGDAGGLRLGPLAPLPAERLDAAVAMVDAMLRGRSAFLAEPFLLTRASAGPLFPSCDTGDGCADRLLAHTGVNEMTPSGRPSGATATGALDMLPAVACGLLIGIAGTALLVERKACGAALCRMCKFASAPARPLLAGSDDTTYGIQTMAGALRLDAGVYSTGHGANSE